MACYISSNDNRFYTAVEQVYGMAQTVGEQNRFPAVKLAVRQQAQRAERRDKTGGRTFVGVPSGLRKRTAFELTTYLTGWTNQAQEPGYGPLFQGALGGAPALFTGGTIESAPTASRLRFTGSHGLGVGQAVTVGEEIRFVAAIIDPQTVQLNAPLTVALAGGEPAGATASYAPAARLPGLSIFDYWDPETSVQRMLCGAAVNRARIRINGDYHEFEFSGPASDLIDSSSFASGQGGLTAYPVEPVRAEFDYALIPGHLGQVWLGANPTQFQTITEAEIVLENDVDLRDREFGSETARCVVAGARSVAVAFSLYSDDGDSTKELYQAARQRSPISVMLQLGQAAGQMFGVYLKSVVPEVPQFDDGETRLEWRFGNCRAQGTIDDEIFVAFG